MNIQLPVFAGFTNYAICRSDSLKTTGCYVINAGLKKISDELIVKLRQGSGKDRQGMAVKAKGLKA